MCDFVSHLAVCISHFSDHHSNLGSLNLRQAFIVIMGVDSTVVQQLPHIILYEL